MINSHTIRKSLFCHKGLSHLSLLHLDFILSRNCSYLGWMKTALHFYGELILTGLLLVLLVNSSFAMRAPYPGMGYHAKRAPVSTRWAEQVSIRRPHAEYPRPQLVRHAWLNLNGVWEFCRGESSDSTIPSRDKFQSRILVPYPVESALSGIEEYLPRVWYRTTFVVPPRWRNERIILHFGGVNWESKIFLNGKMVGTHVGGYDSFSFDITNCLTNKGQQELIVWVYNPVDSGDQPRGKQVVKPSGIWYTSSTGIWQTVWVEPVSQYSIESLTITPDIDHDLVRIRPHLRNYTEHLEIEAKVLDGNKLIVSKMGGAEGPISLHISSPELWSPSNPHLYRLIISVLHNSKPVDKVYSYFGMRKIGIEKDKDGIARITLNNKFIFQMGVLDQGFWPEGIYTAPTDEAIKHDLIVVKKLGFNTIRKHVKVEPERWYYWCDKLGILVWQDMPSGTNSTPSAKLEFEKELRALISQKFNHPSIVMWVIFNEGWGEFQAPKLVHIVRDLDSTRLIDDASGWYHSGAGDVIDIHRYPDPVAPKPSSEKATVEGEFGGLGLPIVGHLWTATHWGYKGMESRDALDSGYVTLLTKLWREAEIYKLSGAIYTQLTDVETEVNGLMTYDRKVIKVNVHKIAAANQGLFPLIYRSYSADGDSGTVEIKSLNPNFKVRYALHNKGSISHWHLYTGPFKVGRNTTVTSQYLSKGHFIGLTSSMDMSLPVMNAESSDGEDLKKGVEYEYFQVVPDTSIAATRAWELVDELSKPYHGKLPIIGKGRVLDFQLAPHERDEFYGFRFSGYFKADHSGVYRFTIVADDGALLWVDDHLVAHQYGFSPAPAVANGYVDLKEGFHKFTLTYLKMRGSPYLNMKVLCPNGSTSNVSDALYIRENDK